jgi:hypothetical protein
MFRGRMKKKWGKVLLYRGLQFGGQPFPPKSLHQGLGKLWEPASWQHTISTGQSRSLAPCHDCNCDLAVENFTPSALVKLQTKYPSFPAQAESSTSELSSAPTHDRPHRFTPSEITLAHRGTHRKPDRLHQAPMHSAR